MNDREQFEAWWKTHCCGDYDELLECWQACAESKQSELDKANARIAQLEEALKEIFDDLPLFKNSAKNTAHDAINSSSDTWLSQHDKAVEVKVLEEANKKFDERTTESYSLIFAEMIESRK